MKLHPHKLQPVHPVMAMVAVATVKALPQGSRQERIRFAVDVRDEMVRILAARKEGKALPDPLVDQELLAAIPNAPDGAALFQVSNKDWKAEIQPTPEERTALTAAAAEAGKHWQTVEERVAIQKRMGLLHATAEAVLGACKKANIDVGLWEVD